MGEVKYNPLPVRLDLRHEDQAADAAEFLESEIGQQLLEEMGWIVNRAEVGKMITDLGEDQAF